MQISAVFVGLKDCLILAQDPCNPKLDLVEISGNKFIPSISPVQMLEPDARLVLDVGVDAAKAPGYAAGDAVVGVEVAVNDLLSQLGAEVCQSAL